MRRLLAASLVLVTLGAAAETTAPTGQPMNQTHHAIDYIELSVTDMAAARAFYHQAFGWEFNDYGPDYAGIRKPGGEGEVGGFNQVKEVAPGGPLVILYSDDLEASLKAVVDAGGSIMVEPFDFPGGRRFHFSDPSGNVLGVWAER